MLAKELEVRDKHEAIAEIRRRPKTAKGGSSLSQAGLQDWDSFKSHRYRVILTHDMGEYHPISVCLSTWSFTDRCKCKQKNIGMWMISHTHMHAHTHSRARTDKHTHTRHVKDTHTHRHTDTEFQRQTDAKTHRHTDTQTHRHTDTHMHTKTLRHTYTHTDLPLGQVNVSKGGPAEFRQL